MCQRDIYNSACRACCGMQCIRLSRFPHAAQLIRWIIQADGPQGQPAMHPQADAVDTSAVLRRARIQHALPLLLTRVGDLD